MAVALNSLPSWWIPVEDSWTSGMNVCLRRRNRFASKNQPPPCWLRPLALLVLLADHLWTRWVDMGKQRKATTKSAHQWPSVLLSTQTEALYGWKSNFPFPCQSVPGLFLHNTVSNLLLLFSFFKARSPNPGVHCQLTPPFVAFLLDPNATSHPLAAAGSFSLLADVSSCRGTWVFWLCFVFSDSSVAASSPGSRGEKKAGQVCTGSFGAVYLVQLMSLTFPRIHWVCTEQMSWQEACASQTLPVQSKANWNFTFYFRWSRSCRSSGVKQSPLDEWREPPSSIFLFCFLDFKSPWTPWFCAA